MSGPGRDGTGAGPHVVVVGGGLAGLAAAAALVDGGCRVTLLESRRRCGGRAASFDDPSHGGLVDACQHVAMGCCTNFLDLCRRGGIDDALRRDRTLWFIGPDGDRSRCTPSRILPAPLHLAPLLWGMSHFSLAEKVALARGMLKLARLRSPRESEAAALEWLRSIGQPDRVIRLFWQPVIESALGESIDLVGITAARKVAVDGFLAHRDAADLIVPTAPLGILFGQRFVARLEADGVALQTAAPATAIERDAAGRVVAIVAGEHRQPCDAAILAVPWKAAGRLLPDVVPVADDRLSASPITGVHLWFDRDILDLPHAVLVGRVSQWVFRGGHEAAAAEGYCQVVISASRGLLAGDRGAIVTQVVAELREVFPAARDAVLRSTKVVTDPTAVLSVRPGVDSVRPETVTAIPNLFLAGDWTATGWPSTMEGAIRSGRLAAAALGRRFGIDIGGPVADLPRSLLTRLLVGR